METRVPHSEIEPIVGTFNGQLLVLYGRVNGVFDSLNQALPQIDIGGEFKNQARAMHRDAKNHAQFYNSPPTSIGGRSRTGTASH
jgi:hypothetical protein